MRAINKNEVRLLVIFSGAVLLMVSVLLVRYGLSIAAKDREQLVLLKTQYENYLRLQQKAPYWEARKKWQELHPLPPHDSSGSDSDFAERIQRSLTDAGLRIEEQQLKEPTRKDSFIATNLVLKATGELESLIRWMAATQKAGNYIAITALTLRANPNTSTMVAMMELSQLFSPPTSENFR